MTTAIRKLPNDFVWSDAGQKHIDYGPDDKLEDSLATYTNFDDLGSGGQATLSVVKVKGHAFARKRMKFELIDEEGKREARILEELSHRHIIQLVGSYTLRRHLYLLLYPVANGGTLKELMSLSLSERDVAWEKQMKESMGCIASAVAFLHSKKVKVKHKDLKPSNILFDHGCPILTDFGLSNSFKGKEDSLSTGVTGMSVPYAAPEVIEAGERRTSQDVFSLGLVFQDIFWSLKGRAETSPSCHDGGHRYGSFAGHELKQGEALFCSNLSKLAFDGEEILSEENTILCLIRGMTATNPRERPTAESISYFLQLTNTCFGKTCRDCCIRDEDAENTIFQAWTGLPTSNQVQGPYDEDNLDQQIQEAEHENQGHDALDARAPPWFDWAGEGIFHLADVPENDIPLRMVHVLGQGGSGRVDAVRSLRYPSKLLARKTVRLRNSGVKITSTSTLIKREAEVLQRLRLPHIVQIIGSYEQKNSLSILMVPVCECDLEVFITQTYKLSSDPRSAAAARSNKIALKRSMACLAHTIKSLHDKSIRHMDIKPKNVLVKMGKGYPTTFLTDFGTARDFSDNTDSRTAGPRAYTRRYAPPESHDWKFRGRPADIFFPRSRFPRDADGYSGYLDVRTARFSGRQTSLRRWIRLCIRH